MFCCRYVTSRFLFVTSQNASSLSRSGALYATILKCGSCLNRVFPTAVLVFHPSDWPSTQQPPTWWNWIVTFCFPQHTVSCLRVRICKNALTHPPQRSKRHFPLRGIGFPFPYHCANKQFPLQVQLQSFTPCLLQPTEYDRRPNSTDVMIICRSKATPNTGTINYCSPSAPQWHFHEIIKICGTSVH